MFVIMGGACRMHGRDEKCIQNSENLKRRDHVEDLGVSERVTLKWTLKIQGGRVCIEFIWLRTGISGKLL
jgi:hypothetical protein